MLTRVTAEAILFAPPLVIAGDEIDALVAAVDGAISDAEAAYRDELR